MQKTSHFYLGCFGIVMSLSSCNKSGLSGKGAVNQKQSDRQEHSNPSVASGPNPTTSPVVINEVFNGPCKEGGQPIAIPQRKILFYAPNSAVNQISKSVTDVKASLENRGYKVDLVATFPKSASGEQANGCELFRTYTQAWVWLQCLDVPTTPSMDEAGQQAMREFFNSGRAFAVLPDNHYDNNGKLHCAQTTDAHHLYGTSKDMLSAAAILDVGFSPHNGPIGNKKVSEHPLGLLSGRLEEKWSNIVGPTEANKSWRPLISFDTGEAFAGFIEKQIRPRVTSVGFVNTTTYDYHGFRPEDLPIFNEIADYLEGRIVQGSSLALTDERIEYGERVIVSERPDPELQDMLTSPNATKIAEAVIELASLGQLSPQQLQLYLLHPKSRIRNAAIRAFGLLPDRDGAIEKLNRFLSGNGLTAREKLDGVSALVAAEAKESAVLINDMIQKESDPRLKARMIDSLDRMLH